MRRSGIVVFLVGLFIVWLVLVAYLAVSQPPPVKPPRINIGIVPYNEPAGTGSFSLDDTDQLLGSFQFDLPNETTQKEIYYVLGQNVDEHGNASSWLYGVRYQRGASLFIFNRKGWTDIPWSGPLPDQQVYVDAIFPLSRLFKDNRDSLVLSPASQWQVELYNGTYWISVTDPTATRVLAYNATTGALIQTYEE